MEEGIDRVKIWRWKHTFAHSRKSVGLVEGHTEREEEHDHKPDPGDQRVKAMKRPGRNEKMSQEAKSQEIGMGWGKCFRLRP